MPTLSRRHFLAASAFGAWTAPFIDPIPRKRPSHLKFSIAAYSYRQLLDFKNPKMDMFGFIDAVADLGADGVEPTSYWFPEGFDAAYLRKLQQYAFMQGLDISGTAIRNDFCLPPGPALQQNQRDVARWIEHASTLGAPVMRVFGGDVPSGEDEDAVVDRVVKNIESLLPLAVEKGVTLALENHGGITTTPAQLLRIVKAVHATHGGFGVNLDTGNFHGEDPYADIALLAPYAVNVQVKTEITPRGKPTQEADLGRIINVLRQAKYSGYVVLEYEAAEDPLTGVPKAATALRKLLASDD